MAPAACRGRHTRLLTGAACRSLAVLEALSHNGAGVVYRTQLVNTRPTAKLRETPHITAPVSSLRRWPMWSWPQSVLENELRRRRNASRHYYDWADEEIYQCAVGQAAV